ncbi:MAG: winged helix-turn-helix domain-containing protein [Desulfurococcaceae archaeon]
MIYRSRIDIIEKIMDYLAMREKAFKTHILYSVNLNTISLEKYLRLMTQAGLIYMFKEGRNIVYILTPKGFEILEKLKSINEALRNNDRFHENELTLLKDVLRRALNVDDQSLTYRFLNGKSGLRHVHLSISYRDREYLILFINEKNVSQYLLRSLAYSILVSNDTELPLLIVARNKGIINAITNLLSTSEPKVKPKFIII